MKRDWQSRSGERASRLRAFLAFASFNGSATFFYLVGLVFGLSALVGSAHWWPIPLFSGMILILFLLDYFEYRRYGIQVPPPSAVLLLCLRFFCVTLAALLPPGYILMFYLTLPFRTTIYFGQKAGYGMAAIIILIYIALSWFNPGMKQHEINSGDLYFLGICIWSVLKAKDIVSERESQQREYQSRMHAEALLAEVRRSHQQLSIYTEQVAALAAVEERYRVAREIHDSLGHALTAILLQLEKALACYTTYPQEALQSVQVASDTARVGLQDMRRSVSALRTEEQPFSCAREIARLAAQLRQSGLSVDVVVTGDEEAFSRRVLTTLYRIVQEGCTNIQRHAQASNVQIMLDFGSQSASLQLSDDGIGFDPFLLEQQNKDQQQYGILGMQERLRLVNGALKLESTPGQGTLLIATMYKQASEDSISVNNRNN